LQTGVNGARGTAIAAGEGANGINAATRFSEATVISNRYSSLGHSGSAIKAADTVAQIAKNNKWKKTNYFSHGQRVYYDAKSKLYISKDIDAHTGGTFKAAKTVEDLHSRETRLGTYDSKMNRIGD
jgi:hypothetical protein